MKQRIEFVDLAKGICISLVVLLHVYGDLSGTTIKIMNLFRMPLYFVLSGLFFKTYGGIILFLKKKTNKLLIPFLFSFLFVIIPSTVLLNWKGGVETTIQGLLFGECGKINLGINGASWFLICLFVLNSFFYVIFLISRHHFEIIVLLSCVCGVAGYILNDFNIYLPLWMDSALTAMPFFMMGYALRKYGDLLYNGITVRDYQSVLLSSLILLSVYFFDEWQNKGLILYGNNEFDISILSLYIGGFSGTYSVLLISKFLNHVRGLSFVGRYSIVVLLTHLPYLFIFRNLLYQLRIPQNGMFVNLVVFVVIMLIEVPTIRFCIKYLPYCFAQKDLWH